MSQVGQAFGLKAPYFSTFVQKNSGGMKKQVLLLPVEDEAPGNRQ